MAAIAVVRVVTTAVEVGADTCEALFLDAQAPDAQELGWQDPWSSLLSMIKNTTLDNGLQVVTEEMSDVRSVALSFWVGTGSRDESVAEWGLSHFLEHLLFKGSETRSALEIAEAIDGVGGDMNAFTTKECTAFYLRVLDDDVELAFDILCDIMCAPAFDQGEIDAERQVVLEEILMRGDDAADLAHETLAEALFEGHCLGREILGTKSNVGSFLADDIRRFFEHHYRPHNMVFAAAGHIEHDAIVEGLQRRWVERGGGERPKRVAPPDLTDARRLVVVKRPTDQAHIVAGMRAPDRHNWDRYAVSVLDCILGGGMSSRLFQEVREKRGLAYTVYSSYVPYEDCGELSFYVGTTPKRAPEALDVMMDQLRLMADKGVSVSEAERAKRSIRATSALSLEDSLSRMSRIGRSLLLHGDVITVDEVSARIDAVTLEDIARVAGEVLRAEPAVVAVGPIDEKVFANQ